MLEDVARPRRPATLIEQFGLNQAAEHVPQSRFIKTTNRAQHFIREIAAQDSAQLRHLPQCRKPVEPRHQLIRASSREY